MHRIGRRPSLGPAGSASQSAVLVAARGVLRGVVRCVALGGALGALVAGCVQAPLRDASGPDEPEREARRSVSPLPLSSTRPEISGADIAAHVAALTDPRTEGRATASAGEALAADYVARTMARIGLAPAGDDATLHHAFEYSAGVALGPANRLELHSAVHPPESLALDRDWRPLAFSKTGDVAAAGIVFAGYGVVAPAEGGESAIDEYAGLEVRGRWVLVRRDLPPSLPGAARQRLMRHASLRHKTMVARDRGAVGILFVNGPDSGFEQALVPLRFDAALAGSSIAVVSIAAEAVDRWLAASGAPARAFAARFRSAEDTARRSELPGLRLAARIDLETRRERAHNLIGRLQVGARASAEQIVLGAHLDHLGRGEGSGSLAEASERGEIHPGADDNASGVAVLLELAESLAARRARGESLGERDFVFAAWSGEELGLLGSEHWAEQHVSPHASQGGPIAYLNFDMVGRLDEALVVHGTGSSTVWPERLAEAARRAGSELVVESNADAYLPTDSTSFYTRGIPILAAFTGVHAEYHTPRDCAARLDVEGAARIAHLFEALALDVGRAPEPPTFVAQAPPTQHAQRGGLRVFLGTIPDYARTDETGVRLAGVAPGGPAEGAGLRRGDVVVEVDGRAIENLYDFTYALEALEVGRTAQVVVLRDGERERFSVVPRSRD